MPGTLFVVATPIGNLDDITLRALRVLRDVAVIAAEDTRRTAHLLARHGIATPTTSLHEHNEEQKAARLLARLAAGEDVALVSDAGTPTISDPGGRIIRRAIDKGIRVEPIPGANAAIAALSVSGLSTETFAFLGFPPIKLKDRKSWLDRLRTTPGTAIFYEAPHRIRRTLAEIAEILGDRPICIGRELTKIHEELVRGPISSVSAGLSTDRGEFTVVVDVGSVDHKDLIIGQTTDNVGMSRRALIADAASKLGVQPNALYEAVERLRK
jgi:16S rRNA (cytidine1402-2'-O)-methyltransferase